MMRNTEQVGSLRMNQSLPLHLVKHKTAINASFRYNYKYRQRIKKLSGLSQKEMSSQFVPRASPEQPVSVLCKAVFFCLLFKSPVVTWSRFVLHYLCALIHLQPKHTDAPMFQNGAHWRRTPSVSSFSPKLTRPKRLRFRNKEELFYAHGKILAAGLKSVWIIHEERLLSHASTCRSTMFYCTGGQLLPSNLLDGGAGMKQRLQQVSCYPPWERISTFQRYFKDELGDQLVPVDSNPHIISPSLGKAKKI